MHSTITLIATFIKSISRQGKAGSCLRVNSLRKLIVSSTMGVGVSVNPDERALGSLSLVKVFVMNRQHKKNNVQELR